MSRQHRPERLQVDDRVRFDGSFHTVVAMSGTEIGLADEHGRTTTVQLAYLLAAEDFELLGSRSRRILPRTGVLDGVPKPALDEALWWERHIVEVLYGLPPDASADAVPQQQYDPLKYSLTQREEAKARELTSQGHTVKPSTVKHRRQRYEARGLVALVDGRTDKRTPRFGRADDRVVEAMRTAIIEATDASSRTAGFLIWRTGQILAAAPEPVAMPSRATCYRLLAKLSAGLHTTGSARTRRSLANRPDGPFSSLHAAAPGELMQIDSTPLDVLVRLDDGVDGRVELTGMIDVATRTVTAAVLRPTTKSVDASVLLARTMTPEPMRPGWADALRMARSVLPHRRLLELDARLEHAAAKPVIMPDTIVCDHGKVFVSRNFRASCRFLGINFQPAHKGTPTDKPHIERMLGSVGTLFSQFVAGYTGSSVERRGRNVEGEPLWSMLELQELLDEWIVASWQNRPHDGLRDPRHPGHAFTPNEKYAAMVEAAGYLPVALSAEDYIELLPARWRAINAYGVKINHRTYDSKELGPVRQQPSGVKDKRDLWEIHHDPYDVSRIWVRNHWDSGWITATWKHLGTVAVPFGELAWDHARKQTTDPGRRQTEEEITAAVRDLLERAAQGPSNASTGTRFTRERRVAARTKATTAEPTWSRPPEKSGSAALTRADESASPPDDVADDGRDIATVIPLGVFDPYQEAKKRW
ncbi:integrase [Umezawaea sp. Da 62-37]|uniref:integrase n=1 Tax=Umezawaea sp. Da 62-37 TaxID=3075927 RepID=UPI0028F74B45|nr:integrase [Umezawaea sp. Da 62-37]WNV83031.1 integrase [Umezawaea sp. Da 62-37]